MNSAPKGGKQEYLARKKKRIDKMFLGGIGNVEKVLDRQAGQQRFLSENLHGVKNSRNV